MDFSFTEEQDELAALARRIFEGKVSEERMREIEAGQDRFDPDLWNELAKTNILGIALPDDVGGSGYGLIEQCRVLIEAGRTLAPVPILPSIVMGAMAIAEFGTSEQKAAWASPAALGEKILTAALVEDLNFDVTAPTTRAVASGEGWTLTGEKTTVPFGPIADLFLVAASTREGTTMFLVQPDDSGVRMQRQRQTNRVTDGLLVLDGVQLGPDRVLGRPGEGAEIARWIEQRATLGLCAHQLGVIERSVEMTAEYSKERVQFDRPIATFQAVGQRMADAYIDVEGLRLNLWQVAWRLSEGLPADKEVQSAKFWAADAGHRVAHTTVHIHGGVGIDLDHPVHRYFIAAKANEFALGSATEQLRRLGRILAEEPVGALLV